MKLTSDEPYWLMRNGPLATYPQLSQNLDCDCLIIGAGITGAMLSDRLARDGYRVVVLDARNVGTGSTSASTALLQYDIDIPLVRLSQMIGLEPSEQAYQLSHDSIGWCDSLMQGLAEPIDFRRTRSIYLASDDQSAAMLAQEATARQKIGLDVSFHEPDDLMDEFGIQGTAAISTRRAASCDPYRMTHALLKRARRNSAQVFARSPVTEFETDAMGSRVRSTTGTYVSARWTIVACGYESAQLLREPIVQLNSTYAVVSQPIADLGGWNKDWMLWEAKNPYLYFRVTADGRLLAGGEDDDTVDPEQRDAQISHKALSIHSKVSRLLPQLRWNIDRAWAGTFGQTKDGLPYIGESPEMPGFLFALGYGGNGTTFSRIACEIIASHVSGQAMNGAQLFRFGR